jgi:aldehyde:ferredoxin oxidoreductase
VPLDDQCFPLLWNDQTPDRVWRFPSIEGVGEIEGPSVEYRLFAAGTGVDWPEATFEQAVARVHNLERALQVRHWSRDRTTDALVLPYFEQVDSVASPWSHGRHKLERDRFGPVADAFYALHGWDVERGWPTRERLDELGLGDVYEPMVDGAARARALATR